jgi:hypothetical protein
MESYRFTILDFGKVKIPNTPIKDKDADMKKETCETSFEARGYKFTPLDSGELELSIADIENPKEGLIIDGWSKKWSWDNSLGYKTCPICKGHNIKHLTKSTWWVFYFECADCNKIMLYNHGDAMGGGRDAIYTASLKDVENDLNGEYKDLMKLD